MRDDRELYNIKNFNIKKSKINSRHIDTLVSSESCKFEENTRSSLLAHLYASQSRSDCCMLTKTRDRA